jgi:hypothetical protein
MDIPKYKSFDDMETFRVEAVIPEQLPDTYRQREYQRLREELGRNLIDILDRFHSPCMVELFDFEIDPPRTLYEEYHLGDRIRLTMKVKPIRMKYVANEYWMIRDKFLELPKEKISFIKRIRWAFTGKAE